MRPKNFRDVLQAQSRQQPDKTAFIYLEHGEREVQRLVSFRSSGTGLTIEHEIRTHKHSQFKNINLSW
jgi:acyl-CoA synthetase (AMP-forming)/AMP-acid ligase II